MIDWKAPLAFEDVTGRYPARFDFDPDARNATYVRVRIYGQKFASPFNPATHFTGIKADERTGASLTSTWPGKVINVDEDLMAGLDPETGQERTISLTEHKRLVQQAVTAALAKAGKPVVDQLVTVKVSLGNARVVSVENAP